MKLSRIVHFVMASVFLAVMLPILSMAGPLEEAMILHLPFDEGNGNTATDIGPHGFEARLEGDYKWAKEAQIGGGIEFTSGRAIVPDEDRLDVEQLTAMAWIFPTEISKEPQCHNWGNMIYQKSGASDDSVEFVLLGGAGACLYINSGPGGNKRMGPFNGGDVDNSLSVLNMGLQEDKWYHIAGTFDGKAIRIFLDGEMVGEKEIAGDNPSIVWNDNDSSIGGRDHNNSWFVGIIDEFMLFSEALDVGEIKRGMLPGFAVEPMDKLTSTWGRMKTTRPR